VDFAKLDIIGIYSVYKFINEYNMFSIK